MDAEVNSRRPLWSYEVKAVKVCDISGKSRPRAWLRQGAAAVFTRSWLENRIRILESRLREIRT